GGSADATILPHADHLHVFRTVSGVQAAARLDVNSCANWPTGIEGHHVLRMGSVHGLDLPFAAAKNSLSAWVTSLLDKGAVMVSIRGKVEPSPITRKELRRQRERYLRDIHAARAEGRMDDQQQEEMLATLESVEGAYASGKAFPTLVETSVVAAFTGHSRKRLDSLGNGTAFEIASMDNRQELALAESWIGSPARANPNLMDLPSSTVAYSGLPSLSTVGDARGINVGFTVHDRQEALMSATKSSDQDIYPIGAVVGSSGAGKAVALSTILPTPTGYTTMGKVAPGDEVLGRDGHSVRVAAKSPVKAKPDLYRVTFSDGQSELADYGHQWVVSDHHDRHAHRDAARHGAVESWEAAHVAADAVAHAAGTYPGTHVSTAADLAQTMQRITGTGVETAERVAASLTMMDIAPLNGVDDRQSRSIYPTRESLSALAGRIRQRHAVRPRSSVGEHRMTTGEMLAEGLHLPDGAVNFAIGLPESLDLPVACLPEDPYTVGARFAEGRDAPHRGIPVSYLRASREQRLALLQGLADAAGTVADHSGRVELTLTGQRLATDVLELVRSLGIKATLTDAPAAPGTSTPRYRVAFTTTQPVFGREDSNARLP